MHRYILCVHTYRWRDAAMGLDHTFGAIVGRRLREHQLSHRPRPLSDGAVAALAQVSQSYWVRVRQGETGVGLRLISGLAVSMPDLLRAAIDEIQALAHAGQHGSD